MKTIKVVLKDASGAVLYDKPARTDYKMNGGKLAPVVRVELELVEVKS